MVYSSVQNSKIKDIKKLNTKKGRLKNNEFLVEGPHLVLEAFKQGYLKTLILKQDEVFSLDVETMHVTSEIINYISELETPYNVLGICSMPLEKKLNGNILILDGVRDPGNLGTIIRSCVAFNIGTILLSEDCADVYSSKVLRASQGMIFHINIIIKNLELAVLDLKKEGYYIYATKVSEGNSLNGLEKNKKFAIIMGNEGAGVSENILELADSYLHIDMNPVCESLNVGVATSIILYELNK